MNKKIGVSSPTITQTASPVRQYWALMANPTVYRIGDIIQEQEIDVWRVQNHEVRAGDYAIIWKARGNQSKRGIVCFAEILTDPILQSSTNAEYFHDPQKGYKEERRVQLRYIRSHLLPLWHDDDPDSVTGRLSCCRATGGSVFKISLMNWEELVSYIGGFPGFPSLWLRDELLLVLDLYLRHRPALPPELEIETMSALLERLPLRSTGMSAENSRSPEAVSKKLNELLQIESANEQSAALADVRQVWNEFSNNPERLREIASAIFIGAQELIATDEAIQFSEEVSAPEGQILFRLHQVRERNKTLVKQKKAQTFAERGRLDCEVCGFNFSRKYGHIGDGFIECHHTKPVSQMQPRETTRLIDLALVCANCHRMLHSAGESCTIADLRAKLSQCSLKESIQRE